MHILEQIAKCAVGQILPVEIAMFAANCFLIVLALFAPLFVCAASAAQLPLTVLMDFEAPHSEISLRSLRQSLNQLLIPVHMAVDVELKSDLAANSQFGELVVFKMKGSCSMAPMPPGPLYDERGPLALAYTSDGQVLHFGEVECDRVRHSLQRLLGWNSSLKSQQTYGSALAVVIAHEVYHMLGNARLHTHDGLTKSALSASELMDTHLAMPRGAQVTIERQLHSELPE